jgi:hypothetical protein
MDIKYTVTSCSEDPIEVTVKFNGSDVKATVTGLTVELTSEDERMGHTFRFTPSDLDAAKELFAVGEEVTLTFSKAE